MEIRQAAVHLRMQGVKLGKISCLLRVPRKTLNKWGLTEPPLVRSCTCCGVSFEYRHRGGKRRSLCSSPVCVRAVKNQKKRAWQKTPAGREERRRNRRMQLGRLQECRLREGGGFGPAGQMCRWCGKKFYPPTLQAKLCSPYCKRASVKHNFREYRVGYNRARYQENAKIINRNQHERMTVESRIKREDGRWMRRVRARLNQEPTPIMWALLYELRRLRRGLAPWFINGKPRLPELPNKYELPGKNQGPQELPKPRGSGDRAIRPLRIDRYRVNNKPGV